MKTLCFQPIDAWTFIDPGVPDEVGAAAATRAASFAERPISSKDHARLVREFGDLARYRDTFATTDFAVLTTSTPSVMVIAYTSVHYFDGDGAEQFVVDDAWEERRNGGVVADPDISRTETPLGTATRIALRHAPERAGFLRGRTRKTSVRWVQPFSDDVRSSSAILTSIIPHESNVDIALPHVDRLALGLRLRDAS
ncbi:hypothetical protein DEJ01_15915 [Curtobacterium sp. MCLR17_040]|uniref:hypothetical protein n=1 Tax=Curtobacterium sp. MCLR17_040 TaxID=2175625 RepID=UPI000DA8CA33|nr:hypothetical protein [Curtobacterium sp. MCLR17_040]PZE98623.1 hypothetical protein DEJ01_15915 [Curtobacterium sp. MCLR17_040]